MSLKKISLLSIAMLSLSASIAAAKKPLFVAKKNKVAELKTIEQKVNYAKSLTAQSLSKSKSSSFTFAKTTAIKSRIIAYSSRSIITTGWELQDSAKLFFGSPDRGGDLESENILFDSSIFFSIFTSSLINDNSQKQNFDVSNNIISTLNKVWDVSSFENKSQSFFTYTTGKKVATDSTQSWDGTAWENSNKRKVTYNAANQILIDSNFNWSGASWEISSVTINVYNVAGKVTKTTIRGWSSPVWLTYASIDFTYDASGFLTQALTKSMNSSFMLENSDRTIYTNDAFGNPLIEKTDVWNPTGLGSWVNSQQILNQYDASKNLIVAIYQNWETTTSKFDTLYQNRYTYNTYGQVKTEKWDTLNVATNKWVIQDSAIYYYEDHSPTSIKEVATNGNSLVYPVPANEKITITANIGEAQKIYLVISDLQGRTVYQINENSNADLIQAISVENIPSGNYFLNIIGSKGFKSIQKISVLH